VWVGVGACEGVVCVDTQVWRVWPRVWGGVWGGLVWGGLVGGQDTAEQHKYKGNNSEEPEHEHLNIKEKIIRLLTQWISNPDIKGW
jgi:hypothetical protein